MKKKKYYWGIMFLVAAVLIVVNGLGFFTMMAGISFLGIILSVILVAVMIGSILDRSFGGILFPAAFLCIIYAQQWNLTQITPWPVLFTALFGTIGLNMIFKKHPRIHVNGKEWTGKGKWKNHENFDKVINEEDGNVVNCSTTFGSSIKYINSDRFDTANLECSFGALKVYFDNVILNNGRGIINMDVSFGAAELYIPKSWKVIQEIDSSFGAVDIKNGNVAYSEGNQEVLIRGDVSFGGITIIYV